MESLADVSKELVTLLNFHITEVKRAQEPSQQIANADTVCTYYQAVGICELLLDAEVDFFFHHLIRSAQTRRWQLEREQPLEPPPLKFLKASNTRGFHCALATRQWTLAGDIARLSMATCAQGVEYAEDFCCAQFLHRHVLDAPQEELLAILDRFEAALEGGSSTHFELCRNLLAHSQEGCAQAFSALLDERAAWLKKMKRESIHATDALFVPFSSIFVEGLAWLNLMEKAGLQTEAEYPYCPSLARRARYAPFVVSTFPSLPL